MNLPEMPEDRKKGFVKFVGTKPAESPAAKPAGASVASNAEDKTKVAPVSPELAITAVQPANPIVQEDEELATTTPANQEIGSPEDLEVTEIDELNRLRAQIGAPVPFKLTITIGNEAINTQAFDQDIVTIGRDEECDVVIDNLGTSRTHAEIMRVGKFYILRDLQSKTGTFVRGKKIEEYFLNDGDEIFLAKHTIAFQKLSAGARWQEINKGRSKKAPIFQPAALGQKRMPTMAMDFRGLVRKKEGGTASLLFTKDNQRYVIDRNATFFGKDKHCDIRLVGFMISECHALIVQETAGFMLYHLGVFRPPLVNKKPVAIAQIKDGDVIKIGDIEFVFEARKAGNPM